MWQQVRSKRMLNKCSHASWTCHATAMYEDGKCACKQQDRNNFSQH